MYVQSLHREKAMSDDEYGPSLPPGFISRNDEEQNQRSIGPSVQPYEKTKSLCDKNDCRDIGPAFPRRLHSQQESQKGSSDSSGSLVIGPVLPSHLVSKETIDDKEDSSANLIGPVLPSHLTSVQESEDSDVIGPSLPSHLNNRSTSNKIDSSTIGPTLPVDYYRNTPGENYEGSDSEDDYVGPRPSEMAQGNTDHHAAAEFEARAKRMKDHIDGKTTGEDKTVKRESWMTVLPDCLGQNIGLQARSFRVHQGPDMSDRSAWTDTPADRERKLKEQSEGGRKRKHEESKKSSRDTKLAKEIDQYNKSKRSESLLELHQKKLKSKQKEEDEKPAVRRPFDRETDLEVNKFDDAQRKSIIKKSQNLNSRFGHGKTQFL